MPFVFVNGVRLHYETAGNGPSLVMLHGLGNSTRSLSSDIGHFSRRWHVVAIDARGHGLSDKPPEFTLADHAGDVLGVMDALGIARAALMGRSMGSYIAQAAACLAPQRFSDLVLVVTKSRSADSGVTALARKHAGLLEGKSSTERGALLLELMMAPGPERRRAALVRLYHRTAGPPLTLQQEQAATAATARFDLTGELARIEARTLVMSGRHDPVNPWSLGEETARLIGNARHVILEDAGHLPAIEARAAYLAHIEDFLAGVR